jgi:hypothetical protein
MAGVSGSPAISGLGGGEAASSGFRVAGVSGAPGSPGPPTRQAEEPPTTPCHSPDRSWETTRRCACDAHWVSTQPLTAALAVISILPGRPGGQASAVRARTAATVDPRMVEHHPVSFGPQSTPGSPPASVRTSPPERRHSSPLKGAATGQRVSRVRGRLKEAADPGDLPTAGLTPGRPKSGIRAPQARPPPLSGGRQNFRQVLEGGALLRRLPRRAVERLGSAGAPADGQTEPSAASRRLRTAPVPPPWQDAAPQELLRIDRPCRRRRRSSPPQSHTPEAVSEIVSGPTKMRPKTPGQGREGRQTRTICELFPGYSPTGEGRGPVRRAFSEAGPGQYPGYSRGGVEHGKSPASRSGGLGPCSQGARAAQVPLPVPLPVPPGRSPRAGTRPLGRRSFTRTREPFPL